MRKMFLGLVATAALASPLAATAANAASPLNTGSGVLNTTTYSQGTWGHQFKVGYTCNDKNAKSTIAFTLSRITPSGSGTGLITPDNHNKGGTFTFKGVNGNYHYAYSGTYAADGTWTDASVTADDGTYGFGTTGATADQFGSVVGSFTGIPDCTGSGK